MKLIIIITTMIVCVFIGAAVQMSKTKSDCDTKGYTFLNKKTYKCYEVK